MSADDVQCQQQYLSRKTVAEAFWNAELEDELRKRGCVGKLFKTSGDREKYMREIDLMRAGSIYPHDVCPEECKQRGTVATVCIDIDSILPPIPWR